MPLATLADLILAATALAYAVASGLYFLQLAGHASAGSGERFAKPVLAGGTVLHLAHFFMISANAHACPVEGIHQATSLMALTATTTFLFISRFWKIEVVGAFVAPVALAALLAARLVGVRPDGGVPVVRTALLPLHVTTVFVASALFTIASALAATYLIVEKQLKSKKTLGVIQRLPPLEVLDRASHRFLLAGFPLLTIGILTGLFWIGQVSGGKLAVIRQVLAYSAWLLFAAVLLMRSAGGWRGRRAAWGTILGFGCACLVFVVYLVRNGRGG